MLAWARKPVLTAVLSCTNTQQVTNGSILPYTGSHQHTKHIKMMKQ